MPFTLSGRVSTVVGWRRHDHLIIRRKTLGRAQLRW
jgi:hypothetical protein